MARLAEGNASRLAVLVLALLICAGGLLVWKLLKSEEPVLPQQTPEPTRSRVVARRELQPFTLLSSDYLEARKGTDDSAGGAAPPTIDELKDRYLLVPVKRGGEVKREMVAPRDATAMLADAVLAGIPAASTTALGGQLHMGDMVDLLALPPRSNASKPALRADQPTQLKRFENLVVVSITAASEAKAANKQEGVPAVILLALPREQRDEFASAVAGADLVLTRRIAVTR